MAPILAQRERLAEQLTSQPGNYNNSVPLFVNARASYREHRIYVMVAEGHVFAGSYGCVARFDNDEAASQCLIEAGFTRDPHTQNIIFHP